MPGRARTHVPLPEGITDAALRDLVSYSMKRAFNAMQADMLRALAPFDLRLMTFAALSLISENPGLRPSQLADGLAVERGNLVGILDALAARNLIDRIPCPVDGRAQTLHLTEAGVAVLARARQAARAQDSRMVDVLDPDTLATLLTALAKIEEHARTRA